jgi:hypothetical protein
MIPNMAWLGLLTCTNIFGALIDKVSYFRYGNQYGEIGEIWVPKDYLVVSAGLSMAMDLITFM